MDNIWTILNKIAIIGTLIGIPASLFGIGKLIFNIIIAYDSYREPNPSGGYTLVIGEFTINDYKKGKQVNPSREYHRKGKDQDKGWR